MIKAVREGKEQSSWSNPNTGYEGALQRFIRVALDASRKNPFLVEFHDFVAPLMRLAAISSLSQLVLKLTVPGVPDIFQGGELWDFSLVDPDNRRGVDWAVRRSLLAEVAAPSVADLAKRWQDGREKLFVIRILLLLRQSYPELFAAGNYQPLEVGGPSSDHLCAFMRSQDGQRLIVAVPRLVYRLYGDGSTADWSTAEIGLPPGGWRDVFTGRRVDGGVVPVSQLLADFPVAVLSGEHDA